MLNKENYWLNLETNYEALKNDGFLKLPKIDFVDLDDYFSLINEEMGNKTFLENGNMHKKFLDDIGFNDEIKSFLLKMAKKDFKFKGDLTNQYHIARKVEPGNSKEMFRAHFDSHLFTFVFPISIPDKKTDNDAGQLIYFPHLRKQPKSELSNLLTKAWYKKYAHKEGLEKLKKNNRHHIDYFDDMRPLLFLGNTFFHTNYPVSINHNKTRLTLLAHFFDPSPKYGVGNLLRFFRNR